MRRSGSSASSGHCATSAGHHAWASCSASRTTSAPVGQPGLPTNITSRWGSRTSASQRSALGLDRPLLAQLARERVGGLLADVDRAAGAERPAPGPRASHGARRPASQRPSASRVTHSAATESLASPSTSRSAQRAGCSSRTSRPSLLVVRRAAPATPSWLGEPRSRSALIASSAAATFSSARLERSAQPARRHLRRATRVRGRGMRGERGRPSRYRLVSRRACASARNAGAGAIEDAVIGAARGAPRPPSTFRRRSASPRRSPRSRRTSVRAAGAAARGRRASSAGSATRRDEVRAQHAYGKSYLDTIRAFRGRYEHAPDFVARASDERGRRGGARVGGGRQRGRHPLRRRDERRRRRRGARRRHPAVCLDLGALDEVLEVDEVSRAARIQAGRGRAAARGAAGAARHDDALLPAVVRALDARRLDRDARRRPLRDGADPHRRPRRVRSRDHARGSMGVAAAARVRGRAVAGPDAARLRGHARRDHARRGCGCSRDREFRASRGVSLWLVPRGRRGRAGAGAVRAWARQLPPDRRGRGAAHGRGGLGAARARLRVHRLAPSTRCWSGRSRSAARAAALCATPSSGSCRRLARGVPADALRARHARPARRAGGHVRDGDHVGALRRVPRGRRRGDARRRSASRAASRAASPTSIRTARRRTSRCSRRRGAATRSRSGGR